LKKLALFLIALGCLLAVPAAASAATYTVDSIGDQADETPGDEECETSANTCTLRAAIEEANESVGTADAIDFKSTVFKGQLADTITPGSLLPEIEDQLSVEGGSCTTQAGPQGPCVGIQATSLSYGLSAEDVEGVTIEGVAVTGATTGIRAINEAEGLTVRGSWLGVKLDGTNGSGANTGIWLDPGSNEATIGGTEASQRNVIVNSAAEGLDIEGASEAVVRGNYFGVKPDGKTQAANGKDIEITDTVAFEAIENEVGATVASGAAPCDGGCNVISGGTFAGIDLQGNGGNEKPATGPTTIHGNYIGLSADGTETVANGSYGVFAGHADNVIVGEFPLGDANYFAGSGEAIATEEGESFIARGNSFGIGPNGAELTRPGKAVFALDQGVAVPPGIEQNLIFAGSIGIEQRGGVGHLTSNEVIGGSIGIYAKGEPGGGLIASNFIEAASENGILVEGPDNEVRANTVLESGKAGIRFKNPPGIAMTGGLIGGSTGEKENVIEGSGGPAIEILEEALEPGSVTEIARNRGSANKGLFIDLVNGANEGIVPPTIGAAKLGGAGGSGAEPGATVRVFRKKTAETGELESFLGEATADGSGNWTVTYAAAIPGETQIAATQTGVEGGTSELAFAKTEPAPKIEGGGGGGGSTPDSTPPQTKIVKSPKAKTHATTVKFKFSSSEAGSSFECKLDKKPFKRCKSPKTYKKLKPGKHVFKVRAIDKAGNVDPSPAKKKFKVLG
jgi:CSLREA domain-containing protein